MKKLLLLGLLLIISSCAKDDGENGGDNLISVTVTDLQFNQATIEWTRPSLADGTVIYEIVLNNEVIVSNRTGTSYVIRNLSPVTDYTGIVKALDETGQETFGEFSFTTRAIGATTIHNGAYGLRYQFQVDNLAASNITTITGELSISSTDIVDLSPLTDLVSIGSLKIIQTSLTNLDGLENVSVSGETRNLNIWGNDQLENISAITLRNSEFDSVRLEDNHVLQTISGIRIAENGILNLSKLPITSLSGLQTASSINFVKLDRLNNLEDISALQALTNIDNLEIRTASNLTTLNGLQNLTTCGTLQLIGLTSLLSLEELSGLISCSYLNLASLWSLQSLEGLNGITRLDKLSVYGMTTLTSLHGLHNLTEIGMTPGTYPGDRVFSIFSSNITDLTGLTNLTHVRNIAIGYCDAMTSLEGTNIINSWNINSDKRLEIFWNPVLTDYCGLSEFVQNTNLNAWSIYANAYNPSIGQITDPVECSQ